MSVCLLTIGDGRDELHDRSIESAKMHLPQFAHLVQIDDRDHQLGFAGAIASGWRQVAMTAADWVFHLEADFIFNRPVDIAGMIHVLSEHRKLVQLSLKRQPWNKDERAAGGVVEAHPDDFTQITDAGHVWTEHRRYWTTNPSLYSVNWCRQGWPLEERSEGMWTQRLIEDAAVRFGIWGAKFDPPAVEHIGTERAGHGY